MGQRKGHPECKRKATETLREKEIGKEVGKLVQETVKVEE